MQETDSYNQTIFGTLISMENSLIKSMCIDDVFRKKCVFNNKNNPVYIPDELVFIIKTFVFYYLNKKNSNFKYFETIKKKNKIEKPTKTNYCLDYHD